MVVVPTLRTATNAVDQLGDGTGGAMVDYELADAGIDLVSSFDR